MAWTTPRTWVAGELVTAAIMNTHVRDNLSMVGGALTATDGSTFLKYTAGTNVVQFGTGAANSSTTTIDPGNMSTIVAAFANANGSQDVVMECTISGTQVSFNGWFAPANSTFNCTFNYLIIGNP